MSATVEDIALTLVPRLGLKGVKHLLDRFGDAGSVWSATAEELVERADLHVDVARGITSRTTFAQAERELAYCAKHGITPIASTEAAYPALLREIPDYPHVLYVLGHVEALQRTLLTMIGTRKLTQHGLAMCNTLIEQLSVRMPGLTIVSGLALGIDTACHRAALAFGMTTVGVIASALPEITPAQHTAVARDMIDKGGAVITELHSQTKQNGNYFLPRNRILAGLSGGTVVVESPMDGGSMHTVEMADGYHRTLMAVPGRPSDFMSSGANRLIRDRRAQLVMSGEDIVREMMWDVDIPTEVVERPRPEAVTLSDDEAQLIGCFKDAESIDIEELGAKSGFNFGKLSVLLLQLEMSGVIKKLQGNRYARK